MKHEYVLNGSQIVAETWMHNGSELMLLYLYDESGSPIGMMFRMDEYSKNEYDYYFFEKNAFGDIIAIYNSNGTKIGTYTYDTWGNVCSTTCTASANTVDWMIVNQFNPFRYRGYFYDVETGLYYLQSRYYNPELGRFISVDGFISTGTGLLGYNMYIYCNNNPVMYVDPTGKFLGVIAIGTISIGTIIKAVTITAGIFATVGIAAKAAPKIKQRFELWQLYWNAATGEPDTDTPNGDNDQDRPLDENGRPVVEPGEMPRPEDGYIPPKGGPKQVKAPNSNKTGWLDKNGNVWVPAPTGSGLDHGGGHWDVQSPKGGYSNVYPNGKVVPKEKPYPLLPILPWG